MLFFHSLQKEKNVFTIYTAVAPDETIILFYEINYVLTMIILITSY